MRTFCPWALAGLVAGIAVTAVAEEITLTTYYPSPRGVYQDLQVTNSFAFSATAPVAGSVLMSLDAAGNATWVDSNSPLPPAAPLVPSGMVAIFPGGCPSGWSSWTNADNTYLKAGGGAGGRLTHQHTVATAPLNHDHNSAPPPYNTVAQNGPQAQHLHTVDIEHIHDLGPGGTGSPSSIDNAGDDDSDTSTWVAMSGHTHGLTGQTDVVGWGGPSRTTGNFEGGHDHLVNVSLPPWNVGPVNPPFPLILTTAPPDEALDPVYTGVQLCIKN